MATPRGRATGARRAGKLPRLTDRGRQLSPADQKKNIDGWIEGEFEEELRMTAFLDVNQRRQIRLATGVGDMPTFVDEFNNGFSNTSQLSSDEKIKSRSGDRAFGESWSDRPRLRKISVEARVIYRPKSNS